MTNTVMRGTSSHAAEATMDPPPEPPRAKRYRELDSLRGLGAVVVMVSHYLRLWDGVRLGHRASFLIEDVFFFTSWGDQTIIVMFFFLSGFVLSRPYLGRRPMPYPAFLLRRIARIYLPYLAALALALTGDGLLHHPMHVSRWFEKTWSAPVSWGEIVQHLLLIGNYDTAQVNTAYWSLSVEMRLSILLPLLCIPLFRWRKLPTGVFFGAVALTGMILPHFFAHRLSVMSFSNLSDMSLGLLSFCAGIVMTRYLDQIQAAWRRGARVQHVVFSVVTLTFLQEMHRLQTTHLWMFQTLLTALGVCGLASIALCSEEARTLLNSTVPTWLGRISYSLYLVHGTVLFALVHLLFGRLNRAELLAPFLVLSLGLAALFHQVVEQPCIRLSRRVGGRVTQLVHAEAS